MTTGVLIFAYNNDKIDYLKMAEWSMHNIHRHLDLPVCVVTDSEDVGKYNFDKVVRVDAGTPSSRYFDDLNDTVQWYNGNRSDAYELSPWDTTIVLDADYVVASSQLLSTLPAGRNGFLCHRFSFDVTYRNSFEYLNQFGIRNMPMYWATVMMFNRCDVSEMIFDVMQMVKKHWDHYKFIYEFDRKLFRNDYALSIAINTVNGGRYSQLSANLAAVLPEYKLEQADKDEYVVTYPHLTQSDNFKKIKLSGIDFHAMGKKDLGEIIANSR